MPIGKTVLPFLGSKSLPLNLMISALILVGIEEFVERNYKCPETVAFRKVYILFYFFIPSVIVMAVGAYCQISVLKVPRKTLKEKGHVFLWSLFLALFWSVILLWDGKYIVCGFSSLKGNGTEDLIQEGSDTDIGSKIAGIILLFIIFIANAAYVKCYYKRMKDIVQSEEFHKWDAEGKASYFTDPEDSHNGNRKDISFQLVVTKPPPSRGTRGQNTDEEHPDADAEMAPLRQSPPLP